MTGTVFQIGVTSCGYIMADLVEHHPDKVIGTFWLPSTPKDYDELTCKWVDYVLEENQAQALLDDIDILDSEPRLYTHTVILLTGNPNNPGDYSFLAGVTRFLESASLLKALAKHNIPAHTEVSYPSSFYDLDTTSYDIWSKLSLADWEEYIRLTLVSVHGQEMLRSWWERLVAR
ncbi:hypothetical protein LC653_43650 [Nostoc sp. CHAB 5784]|uniref:hypothetical protein n=1 Tax=Nostoc mirabile TaxID=2907820 RepID=UPI001E5D87A5|nr:hypothetical protein [Nostoc mirabile]MCC5670493.1 hypothetical protein [Nostoc mirabile CHAB5784]